MKVELVVMAAGMGSRFGGLKQLEGVGPNGETVMDYAIFDAKRAGVKRVIFVIRKEIEELFREKVGSRYAQWLEVNYAYQELDLLPEGFSVPEGRTKPWGTGHAVLAAKNQVRAPFIVINADDFYGAEAFRALATWLGTPRPQEIAPTHAPTHAMVAFQLANTLSENGTVARGICQVSPEGFLQGVTEHTGLERSSQGAQEQTADGQLLSFTGLEPVSMNIWGFQPSFMQELESGFATFLAQRGKEAKSEFYLPGAVDTMIREGRGQVQVLETPERWFGVTYREDKPFVEAQIQSLVEKGTYPAQLLG